MAPSRLVVRAVERVECQVELGLVLRVDARDRVGYLAVYGPHGLFDALTSPTTLVAVAELDGFVGTGRRARRNRRPPHRTVLQRDIDFNRRIASAVEDLAGVNVDDRGHGVAFFDELAREFVAAPIRRAAKGATYGMLRMRRRNEGARAGLKHKRRISTWPTRKELPEGTDSVIAGASTTESEEALIVREPTARDKAIDKLRGSTDKISGQAADKARELVGQGLERGGEALANVSKLVGDTASSLDDRLGEEYGEYARRAASAFEDAAGRISAKNPMS